MALFIEIKAADGLASRTRLEAGNNRFTVRLGDSYRIFDDQTGIAPTGMAVKRVDNNLIVDGLGKSEVAAGGQPTTVEFAEFYSVCSAGSPCELVVDQGPGGATVAITPGTQPIGALADGSFVLYDPNYAENAPATPPLGDDATLRYALYGLGGAAVLGLAAGGGGGGGGGDDGAGTGTGPDGTLKLTSSTFTNSRTPTITGQGEPGAKVTVRIDTDGDGVPNVTYGTTVAPDFTWSINLANAVPESGSLPPTGLPDASNVGVTSTTAGGVASLPTFVLAFDNTPPAQPVVNTIAGDNVVNAAEKTGGVVIAGTAEAGATVTVTWGSQVRTAVADGSGNWQTPGFDSQSIPGNGPGTITAVVQDLAGNNSAPVAVAVTVNTSPAKLTLASGNEAINANEAAAGITLGGTTDPNAVVTVTWNNAAKPAVTADGNGGWSVPIAAAEIPQLATGSVPYSIAATNAIGNSNTLAGQVAVDAVVPAPPVIASIGGNNVVNAQERAAGVVVTGTAEAGATVAVTWGGLNASATANGSGNWSATFAAGNTGGAAVSAVAVDAAGNSSGAGQLTGVVVDTTPPALTAVPADPIINIADAPAGVRFTGTAEAGAAVAIAWNGAAALPVAMTTATTWEAAFPTPPAPVPTGQLFAATITATDGAGNVATVNSSVIADLVAPAAAVNVVVDLDNQVTSLQAYSVTGVAEPGTIVSVSVGGPPVNVITAPNGSWVAGGFTADPVLGATPATATVTVADGAGNAGPPLSVGFTIVPLVGASLVDTSEQPVAFESLIGTNAYEPLPLPAVAPAPASSSATTSALVPLEQPYA